MREPARRRAVSRARARGGLLFLLLLASSAGIACSTDTAGLERRAPDAASAGGDGGAGTGPSGGAGSSSGGDGGAGAAPGLPPDLASGALEIVHGVIDGGLLFSCLRDAVSGEPLAGGAPEPSAGVPYGGSFSLPTTRWDVSAEDVEVELFVAAAERAPQSCSALRAEATGAELPLPPADAGADAGPEPEPPFPVEPEIPRRAGALRLAGGVIRAGGHYALIATGCTGPSGGSSAELCGPVDELSGTRHTLVLAEIPTQFSAGDGGFGLQFLNASRAVQRADLVLQWESQREPLRVSADVGFAAVRPRDPASVEDEPVGLELHVRGDGSSSFTQAWLATVEASRAGVFAPGSNYLAAYVGPSPEAASAGLSPPRFVLIRAGAPADGAGQ